MIYFNFDANILPANAHALDTHALQQLSIKSDCYNEGVRRIKTLVEAVKSACQMDEALVSVLVSVRGQDESERRDTTFFSNSYYMRLEDLKEA